MIYFFFVIDEGDGVSLRKFRHGLQRTIRPGLFWRGMLVFEWGNDLF